MPVSIPGRLIGMGWSAACVLLHLRTSTVVVRTEQRLVAGEIIEMEFPVAQRQKVRLMGAVGLEPSHGQWTIALIERGENYHELRETLTLTERSSE